MPELMTKQDAIEYLLYMKHDVQAKSPMDIALDTAIEALKQTAIEPEVRHGRWIATGFMDEEGRREYKCSECKSTVLVFDENLPKFVVHKPYCAGCGAKMDGGAENG